MSKVEILKRHQSSGGRMSACNCHGPVCRRPISHSQPTINSIELPPDVARVGNSVKTARDKAALDRFRP